MKERPKNTKWPEIIFKLLHKPKSKFSSTEVEALDKYYKTIVFQRVGNRLQKGQKILEVVPINFTEMMNYIYSDLKGYMHQWLFTNQLKLRLLSKNELWKKFDNKAGYYLYEKYFGEAIRDFDKPIGWAIQAAEKFKEDPLIKRSEKGEKIYTEENLGGLNEAVGRGSYYRRVVGAAAKQLQQSAKSYQPLEYYLEVAERIVDEKLKQAKRELRRNKKSLKTPSKIMVASL